MIADTIVVVLMFIFPTQQHKEVEGNRFKEVFEQADKAFDNKYKIDIEAFKRASNEAAISADEKTKSERDNIMKPIIIDIKSLLQ